MTVPAFQARRQNNCLAEYLDNAPYRIDQKLIYTPDPLYGVEAGEGAPFPEDGRLLDLEWTSW